VLRLAKQLKARGLQIQHVLHSGKLRALQTAQIIADQLVATQQVESITGIGAMDDPEPFVVALEQYRSDVLIASHKPFVSKLCATLLKGADDAAYSFTPGTVACLELSAGQWKMNWMLSPEISPR